MHTVLGYPSTALRLSHLGAPITNYVLYRFARMNNVNGPQRSLHEELKNLCSTVSKNQRQKSCMLIESNGIWKCGRWITSFDDEDVLWLIIVFFVHIPNVLRIWLQIIYVGWTGFSGQVHSWKLKHFSRKNQQGNIFSEITIWIFTNRKSLLPLVHKYQFSMMKNYNLLRMLIINIHSIQI